MEPSLSLTAGMQSNSIEQYLQSLYIRSRLSSVQPSTSTRSPFHYNWNAKVKPSINTLTDAPTTVVVYTVTNLVEPAEHQRTENPLCKIEPITSSNNSFIFNGIQDYTKSLHWEPVSYTNRPVHFINVNPTSEEYIEINSLFHATNKDCFDILQIERIQNPYLLAAFLLKQNEMKRRGSVLSIERLFHGTDSDKIYNICRNNFEWRLSGKNVGSKYGQGICFTSISNYATYYGNEGSNLKVMLVVLVLIGRKCIGKADMVLPPNGFDTTIKQNKKVIVKYEDNEFYPAYKISYTCTDPSELQTINKKQNRHRIRQNSKTTN